MWVNAWRRRVGDPAGSAGGRVAATLAATLAATTLAAAAHAAAALAAARAALRWHWRLEVGPAGEGPPAAPYTLLQRNLHGIPSRERLLPVRIRGKWLR